MDLAVAANYFSDTWFKGWDGTQWVDNICQGTVLPFDRFISEREFGIKRNYVLIDKDEQALENYSAIRLGNSDKTYLVGNLNVDIRGDIYSKVYLLHHARYFVDVVDFQKTISASGMASGVQRVVSGQYWADIERVSYSNSKEFTGVRFTQFTLHLPRDVTIDTDSEVVHGEDYYSVSEAYLSSGFMQCRAMQKRSS